MREVELKAKAKEGAGIGTQNAGDILISLFEVYAYFFVCVKPTAFFPGVVWEIVIFTLEYPRGINRGLPENSLSWFDDVCHFAHFFIGDFHGYPT